MRISGFQKFSMIDYNDKLCAVVFTQACNLRCPYCHNPDLVAMLSGESLIAQEEILEFLKGRVGKLDAIVITGGEPLLQKNLIPFLRELKNLGFLIKLDTNGLLHHTLEKVIESGLVDYIAMDIKTSLEEYEKVVKVQVPIESLIKSINLIKQSGIDHEFRTTLVEGLITENNIYDIGENLIGNSTYYLQNFVSSHHLDDSYVNEIGFSKEKLERILSNLSQKGVKIKLRG